MLNLQSTGGETMKGEIILFPSYKLKKSKGENYSGKYIMFRN
jgi:hypothetical protein